MDYLSAIQSVMNPMCLLCILLGVAVGMVVGTLPGLTSVMAISLITPLTFKLNPTYGFAMLLGVYNSAIFSGGISAIAINTPGTPASIATTFDGYKISQRGRAGFALGVNTIYSVIGGLFSTIALMVACAPLARLALNFGSPEYFWLALFGLSMMISVSHASLAKGLVTGFVGMLLATVGLDPLLGSKRFVGNNISLMDGIAFIPVMIGLFGVGEMLFQIFEHKKEDDNKKDIVDLKDKERVLPTKEEHKRMTIPGLIGSVIGVLVGIVPGTGGDISALISWDVCKRVSKHPEEFGDGSVEGLATTCASNNASIGIAWCTDHVWNGYRTYPSFQQCSLRLQAVHHHDHCKPDHPASWAAQCKGMYQASVHQEPVHSNGSSSDLLCRCILHEQKLYRCDRYVHCRNLRILLP